MIRVAGRGIQGDGKGRSWLRAGGGDSVMRGSEIGGVGGNRGIREEGGIDRTVCSSSTWEGEERGLDVEERTESSRMMEEEKKGSLGFTGGKRDFWRGAW